MCGAHVGEMEECNGAFFGGWIFHVEARRLVNVTVTVNAVTGC